MSSRIKGLYAIVDTTYVPPERMAETAEGIINGGGRIIQLRAKGLEGRVFFNIARTLREMTGRRDVCFIINDRVDIALMVGADGVHLGQEDLPPSEARRLLGEGRLIGFSTHNPYEAEEALRMPVDYISFGPIFPTTTKADARAPVGVEGLRRIKKSVRLPVVAIGGIKEGNLESVLKTGVDSVAIISDILLSGDIEDKVRRLIRMFGG